MSNDMDFFNDEDDGNFSELPAGLYEATVTNATLDETKPEARINVEFTLTNKRKAWLNLRFGEKSKKFVAWQTRELGVYHRAKEIVATGKPLARAFLDALSEILGVSCMIEIDYNEYKGKKYANVIVKECGEGHVPAPKPKQNLGMSEATKKTLSKTEHEEIPF